MSRALFGTRRVLWMPLDLDWQPPNDETLFCCDDMALAVRHECEEHETPFECPDTVIVYHEIFGEFGLPIRDGGPSYLCISNCPFCGSNLPKSGRDAWFDRLEALGYLDKPFEALPAAYKTSAWRSQAPDERG